MNSRPLWEDLHHPSEALDTVDLVDGTDVVVELKVKKIMNDQLAIGSSFDYQMQAMVIVEGPVEN